MVETKVNSDKGLATTAFLKGKPTSHFTPAVQKHILAHKDRMLATADKVNLTLGSDEVYVGLGMAKHVEHMVKMVQTVKNGCNSPSKGHDSPRYRYHLF